jgi:hypothetical protein
MSARIFVGVGLHMWQERWGKKKKSWVKCWVCWFYYLLAWLLIIILTISPWRKIKNKSMNMSEILQWVLIIVIISIPPVLVALIEYYSKKEKTKAETEEIKLKNKITKDITYEQLQKESKRKDIKGKVDIFQQLLALEEQIKSKNDKTGEDLKKLESLEMIKKEFKQSFEEEKNPELAEEKTETKKRIRKKRFRKQNND